MELSTSRGWVERLRGESGRHQSQPRHRGVLLIPGDSFCLLTANRRLWSAACSWERLRCLRAERKRRILSSSVDRLIIIEPLQTLLLFCSLFTHTLGTPRGLSTGTPTESNGCKFQLRGRCETYLMSNFSPHLMGLGNRRALAWWLSRFRH